jgi:hypothetical protein
MPKAFPKEFREDVMRVYRGRDRHEIGPLFYQAADRRLLSSDNC